jgi:hypothetical protein
MEFSRDFAILRDPSPTFPVGTPRDRPSASGIQDRDATHRHKQD